jgi:hypothetical protein
MPHSQAGRWPRWLLAAGAAALLAIAGFTAWLLWPRPAAAPQARQYLNVSACLLTDPKGVGPGTPAAPVWAAMQSASLATHVMITYLPATRPSDVKPMLNTLIQRQCGVIIATGPATAGVIEAGRANPHQHFLLVTAPGSAGVAATPAPPRSLATRPRRWPRRSRPGSAR